MRPRRGSQRGFKGVRCCDVAIASGGLSSDHGAVDTVEDREAVVPVWVNGDPGRGHGDVVTSVGTVTVPTIQFADGVDDRATDRVRIEARGLDNGDELLAAVPVETADVPGDVNHCRGDRLQGLVSGTHPVEPVVAVEVVDIDEHEAVTVALRVSLRPVTLECPRVAQTSSLVDGGVSAQFGPLGPQGCEQVLAGHGDLAFGPLPRGRR